MYNHCECFGGKKYDIFNNFYQHSTEPFLLDNIVKSLLCLGFSLCIITITSMYVLQSYQLKGKLFVNDFALGRKFKQSIFDKNSAILFSRIMTTFCIDRLCLMVCFLFILFARSLQVAQKPCPKTYLYMIYLIKPLHTLVFRSVVERER